jgi:membrane protease YdiL (CAAX protease family)
MDSQSPGLAICSVCGAELRAAARFCAFCGKRTSAAEQELPPAAEPEDLPTDPARPAGDRWHELRVVGWLFGLLLLSSLFWGIAYSIAPSGDFLPWTTLLDGLVIVAFAGCYRAEIVPLLLPSTFDRNARDRLAVATVIQFALLGAAFYLLEKTGVPFERITDEMQRHHYRLWQLIAFYSLAPAVLEEIAFRGIIFNRLSLVLGEREAWLVQAAFFSVLHLSPVIFLTHFAMGLIFGWLRMRTRSLLPGMVLHGGWNASVILLELYR